MLAKCWLLLENVVKVAQPEDYLYRIPQNVMFIPLLWKAVDSNPGLEGI